MAELDPQMRALGETLEKISKYLETLGNPDNTAAALAAPVTQGVEQQSAPAPATPSRFLSMEEREDLRVELRKKSRNELFSLFARQAMKKDVGIPVDLWLAKGGTSLQARYGQLGGQLEPDVAKLLDTSGGSALIREDLEPVMWEMFIRTFPAFDLFPKEPANGLTHTFNRMTSFGSAVFMPELGTVTDDRGTYERDTTPVAILATRRGVSLKNQFAAVQSGSGFNPEQLELQAGLRAIAQKMQYQIFSGHATDSGGDADNELGEYDPNAFTGLRAILNTARAKNADPTGSTPDDMNAIISSAAIEIMQTGGGGPVVAFMNPLEKEVIDRQQDKNVRYVDRTVDVAVGVTTNAINTVFGATPLYPVPGDAIGTYESAEFSGNDVRDIYLLDFSTMSLPWLGSEGPTVLDIPVGVSGQLTRLFIIFGMWGLAVKAIPFNNKIRVKVA